MRIRWWIFLLLIVGLIVGPVIKNIPGFVVIALKETTTQFPLWLAVALEILLIVVTGVLVLLSGQFVSVAVKAKKWSGSRKWKKARKETISGMLNFSEGDWDQAEKKMIAAAGYGDTKLINYLIAAQAAQKTNAFDRRDEYLKLAKKTSPDADIAIGLTQARLQIESEQYEEALVSLSLLLNIDPHNKYINKLFVEVNIELKQWNLILEKLTLIEKQKVFSKKKLLDIQRKAICGVMLADYEKSQWKELQQFWKQQPGKIKKDPVLLLEYAEIMMSFGRDEEIEPFLKKTLKQNPSNSALKLYAKLRTKTPGKQLDFLESLSLQQMDENNYYKALSKLANTAELWGKARDYLQRSVKLDDSIKTRAILANIYEKLGDKDLAKIEREQAVMLLEKKSL